MRPFIQKELGFLIDKPGQSFSLSEIARRTGLSKTTVYVSPLEHMNLIVRGGKRGSYVYTSRVRDYLVEEFPDLNETELIGELLEMLPV